MAKNRRLKVQTKQIKVWILVLIASCLLLPALPGRVSIHQRRIAGETISTHMIDGGTAGFEGAVM